MKRCPVTRWEECCLCHRIRPGEHLVHVSEVLPARFRGWVCDPAGESPFEPCRPVRRAMENRVRTELMHRLGKTQLGDE